MDTSSVGINWCTAFTAHSLSVWAKTIGQVHTLFRAFVKLRSDKHNLGLIVSKKEKVTVLVPPFGKTNYLRRPDVSYRRFLMTNVSSCEAAAVIRSMMNTMIGTCRLRTNSTSFRNVTDLNICGHLSGCGDVQIRSRV